MYSLGQTIFVCIMVFIAGLIDSIAGGGGIISIPAYTLTGMPMHCVMGCNKFSSTCGTSFSVARFMANKAIDVKVAIISAVGAIVGSSIAAHIVIGLSDEFLRTMMVIVLPIISIAIILKKDIGQVEGDIIKGIKAVVIAGLIGLSVGFYDGFIGPGTGTIAIFFFSAFMKYDLKTASGNTKILNLSSNIAALVSFMLSGMVIYQIAIPAAICNIAGNYIGAGLAVKKGSKFIRPVMITVVVMLLGKTFIDFII